ncbi:hypothetical protein [Amycolatopsis minnesotensis]|uniref:Uncharacterized protein n=1 Tax=Amycolatopsis minnesotensis TaxID=337894 RepID=A0ABN2S764_9PSEU
MSTNTEPVPDDTATANGVEAPAPPHPDAPPAPPEWAPPMAPTSWEPYSPPAGAPVVAPTSWEPYSPPAGAPVVAPTSWEPYSPPAGAPVVAPTSWEPYSPPAGAPVVAPMSWEPYSPPAGQPTPPAGQPAQPGPVATTGRDGWAHRRFITHVFAATSPGVWAWVPGAGWKRLSMASEAGNGNLLLLALLAKNNRLPLSYHEDASGQIDQILV